MLGLWHGARPGRGAPAAGGRSVPVALSRSRARSVVCSCCRMAGGWRELQASLVILAVRRSRQQPASSHDLTGQDTASPYARGRTLGEARRFRRGRCRRDCRSTPEDVSAADPYAEGDVWQGGREDERLGPEGLRGRRSEGDSCRLRVTPSAGALAESPRTIGRHRPAVPLWPLTQRPCARAWPRSCPAHIRLAPQSCPTGSTPGSSWPVSRRGRWRRP